MKDELGDRIKENYENRTRLLLPRRTYLIIRLDGVCFSRLTRNLAKPFDENFMQIMQEVSKHLCENIMGARLAFTASDEIQLLITDFDNEKTDSWFNNNLQKIVSVSASIATAYFNHIRNKYPIIHGDIPVDCKKTELAHFDSRAFTISDPTEVFNAFLWRQNDATKNAMNSAARCFYSHKQLHGKKWGDMNEMLFQKGINFNDYPVHFRRGSVAIKVSNQEEFTNKKTGRVEIVIRNRWGIMAQTPLFTSEDGNAWLKNIIPKYN